MKFDELDKKLRVYEESGDLCVIPNIFMVARIDGRSFTRLTKELHSFESPFDIRFRDMMVETTSHLMECGFRIVFGYTQSDEISLVFHIDDNTFGRKLRKLQSVLAGEASAKFSLLLGDVGCFDCRICQIPNMKVLVDYLRWRQEDAFRNALNAHCYWSMRRMGATSDHATSKLMGLSTAQKNELLFQQEQINFNDVPAWQKRGVGLYWEDYIREGTNPITGESTETSRRRIRADFNIPMKDEYSAFVTKLIEGDG